MLITLVIPKDNLGTLLWKLLLQNIGKFQKPTRLPPPSLLNTKNSLFIYYSISSFPAQLTFMHEKINKIKDIAL